MSTSYIAPLFINTHDRKADVIRLFCDAAHTPTVWISELMAKSPQDKLRDILVNMVSALFRIRCQTISARRKPSYLCDSDVGNWSDFDVGGFSYHVTCSLNSVDIRKCKKEFEAHRSPVLLVPNLKLRRTILLARRFKIDQKLPVFALETFFSRTLLFHAFEQRCSVLESWNSVISEYNRRIRKTSVPSIDLQWQVGSKKAKKTKKT